jgi:hypothetical protein
MDYKFSSSEIIARRVLEDCGLDDVIETPLSEIIFGRGAFYEEKPLVGKEGEIITANGRSIITLNSNSSFENRKRFTAAHELGHYEMHRNLHPLLVDSEQELLSWYQGGAHEMEANEFAAELLMPSDRFGRFCKGKVFGPDVIQSISKYFKVSKVAAMLRFARRGNYPVFIVCSVDNKMKWFKRSDDFTYYSSFSSGVPPPEGSVAREMFTTQTSYQGDELKQSIWKSDWFSVRDNEKDIRMYEYCHYVRSYNYCISIIWQD